MRTKPTPPRTALLEQRRAQRVAVQTALVAKRANKPTQAKSPQKTASNGSDNP